MELTKSRDVVCPECDGIGYKVISGADGASYAARCVCAVDRQRAETELRTSIPERFASVSLDNFSTVRSQHCGRAFTEAKKWAREVCPVCGLIFIGPPGTGKTHLAVAALKAAMARGFEGLFCDYQTMLNAIARSWKRDSDTTAGKDIYERAIAADILLIDDLGATRALDWAEDIITDVITARYNAKKPLIVTTNLPLYPVLMPAGIEGGFGRSSRSVSEIAGVRSASRLVEMCKVIDMSAIDDYRPELAKRRY